MPSLYRERHAEERSDVTSLSIRADSIQTRRAVPLAGDLLRSLMMHIWVDADACPKVIKDLLYRAADRWGIGLTLVANQPLRIPSSPQIQVLQVPAGFDIADHAIVHHVQAGDLVVTADIPLAAQVIAHGGQALNPRGQLYTRENIHEHLTMRHVIDELRQSGVNTGGPAPFSPRDRQAFANQLHRVLTHDRKTGSGSTGDGRDTRS
jgi:uncharacterized protein YaiI (UPF0178 family)